MNLRWGSDSFNPCFNGSDSKRHDNHDKMGVGVSFNPCFNGSDSKSSMDLSFLSMIMVFQSLF